LRGDICLLKASRASQTTPTSGCPPWRPDHPWTSPKVGALTPTPGALPVLLDAVEAFAPGLPVVIGGDLNTGNHVPPDFDWRGEALFQLARARGYSWDFTAEGMTTRPSLITPHPSRRMKLDWLAGRSLSPLDRAVVSSVTEDGTPLSDHDAVWCRIRRPFS
ncbi:MAG: hypothetical protein ACU0G0_10615, partial [Pseudooceanicola sp.]